MENINILICGVGGQGTLLTSRILGKVANIEGLDVKISEVHGMAQRGGSVVTHVRMGEKVYSPLVEAKEADFILAFEQLEAYRAMAYLKKDGLIITGIQKIMPMPVILGKVQYPNDLEIKLKQNTNCIIVDALDIAKKCGNIRCANIYLTGILAKNMDFKKESFIEAISHCVPAKTLETNLKAFNIGYDEATN